MLQLADEGAHFCGAVPALEKLLGEKVGTGAIEIPVVVGELGASGQAEVGVWQGWLI